MRLGSDIVRIRYLGTRSTRTRKGGAAQANASVDQQSSDQGPRVEFLLCGLSFPTTTEILSDPNIWIADSAVTVHTTPHEMGMIKTRNATSDDAITVGNGTSERAAKLGSISRMICDKHGNEMQTTTLNDVTHLPNGKFNLFSVTKEMKSGWLLFGDNNSIGLTKGSDKVVFDIVVPTSKGLLFAVYFKRNIEIAGAMQDEPQKLAITEAHEKLGHSDETATRNLASKLYEDP